MGVRLSGGAPKNNTVRQRHSNSGGNASSGEELDDDASSMPMQNPQASSATGRRFGLSRALELALWVLSSAFIVYHGDGHSNFVSLLIWDSRIKRGAFNVASVSLIVDCAIILYTSWWRIKDDDDDTFDISTSTAGQIVVTAGLFSFLMFSVALWPIWSFLTLPLLITLLLASIVVSQHASTLRKLRSQADLLRED